MADASKLTSSASGGGTPRTRRTCAERLEDRRLDVRRRAQIARPDIDLEPRRHRRLRVVRDRFLRDDVVRHDDEVARLGAELRRAPGDFRDPPLEVADRIQLPIRNGFSLWMASPANALPSVSCSAKPTTTALTAEVVSSLSSKTNVAISTNRPMTIASCRIDGNASGTRSARSGLINVTTSRLIVAAANASFSSARSSLIGAGQDAGCERTERC